MGLLRNGHTQTSYPGQAFGAGVALNCRAMWGRGEVRGIYGAFEKSSSVPVGNLSPGVWVLAPKAGSMALRGWGAGGLTGDLVPSYPMAIDLTGAGDLTATAALAVAMFLAMAGSGALQATITGLLDAGVAMAGQGDLQGALTGIANGLLGLTGAGDLDAVIAAYGDMTLDIVVTGTGLSTANVGQAVWAALAASNDDAGTMGALLNAAGASGDPWAIPLEGTYTAADLLRIIAAVLAGRVSGMEAGAPAFLAVDGSTVRVAAVTTEEGNRTDVDLTP